MPDLKWSPAEKRIARQAFDAALDVTLAGAMAEFKARAAAASTWSEMWAVEDFLHRRRRDIDETFDYRYSQLLFVFARLIRDGSLDEAQLAGLSEEKMTIIRSMLSPR